MNNFIENILHRLVRAPDRLVLQEARDGKIVATTCKSLLSEIKNARAFVRSAGLKKGDRCALLGQNSVRWAALDLALMTEGIIVVPLYARQAAAELVGMMKDCGPSLICCGDESLRQSITTIWPEAPRACLFDEVFDSHRSDGGFDDVPVQLTNSDAVTIIYTSGTSGEPKGVILGVGNITYMLGCTNARLDQLMGADLPHPDRVFHYLPFCFAGSWILLLTCLSRDSVLTMSTDLNKLADEMRLADPHYFLNVPALLERVRRGVEEQLTKRGGLALTLFNKGKAAWFRRGERSPHRFDAIWFAIANRIVFPAIRKKLGPNLKALICGSAPLIKETQLFFMMIGIPVLQVYGLTETTAICTMDHPDQVTAGRVGPAIQGTEMKVGGDDEILVRGPNIFGGYWNKPEATASALRNGWFHTGDQGSLDETGNWAIIGRVKNLIVLSSGHNIAPEPIEETILMHIPNAQQVLLVGNGRSYLGAIVTGEATNDGVDRALEITNSQLPHYKQVRAYHILREPFTIENGLLTANGKVKREMIASRFNAEIEGLFRAKSA
jgi:long-chain acyl-CoA synthetase